MVRYHVVDLVRADESRVRELVDRDAVKVQNCRRAVGKRVEAEGGVAHPELDAPSHTDLRVRAARGRVNGRLCSELLAGRPPFDYFRALCRDRGWRGVLGGRTAEPPSSITRR